MGSDVSYTRRLRAWWTNIKLPASYTELTKDQSRGDPNSCMCQGRKLVTFEMDGRQQPRPIGASWTSPHERLRTRRPIEVIEDGKPGVWQLRPGEAEKLHSLRAGCTDALGVRAIDRLTAIGGGWDMNVIKTILHHSNLKVGSKVSHMNGAMQAYPRGAELQEYMRYSAYNAKQACPAPGVCGMLKHSDEEMDLHMDLQEYRSALAQYMRRSPENATQECYAPDVCDMPRNDNGEEEPD